MNPTDEALDRATEALDVPVAPKDEVKAPETPPEKPDSPDEGKKGEEEDEGYTADELESEDESPASPEPKVKEIDANALTPEQKYIVDHLPPLTVRGKLADGSVREFKVYAPDQLPAEFEYASQTEFQRATLAFDRMERKAETLQNEFRTREQQQQTADFEKRDNEAIRQDIAKLQREGELPKFKTDVDDPNFTKDEAYKETQKVLTFMNERNAQYLAEYNQGRAFRRIGFEEAYHMYRRANPQKSPAEDAEDKERKVIARKSGNSRGLSAREMKRPTVRAGTRVDQILDRIDQEW